MREVMEEVGLEVVASEWACDIDSADHGYARHFWQTKILSGEAHITSNEATAVRWFTLGELEPTFAEGIENSRARGSGKRLFTQ